MVRHLFKHLHKAFFTHHVGLHIFQIAYHNMNCNANRALFLVKQIVRLHLKGTNWFFILRPCCNVVVVSCCKEISEFFEMFFKLVTGSAYLRTFWQYLEIKLSSNWIPYMDEGKAINLWDPELLCGFSSSANIWHPHFHQGSFLLVWNNVYRRILNQLFNVAKK